MLEITRCPGTLKAGHHPYSSTARQRVFESRSVSHLLPYKSPASNEKTDVAFTRNPMSTSACSWLGMYTL